LSFTSFFEATLMVVSSSSAMSANAISKNPGNIWRMYSYENLLQKP
jgi:hypothetical protein